MNFTNLCNLILEDLMLEALQTSDLSKINSELEVIKNKFRGDKKEFKKQLKFFKKKFIAKIVKENYNSLLTTYFPQLVKDKNTTDDAFFNLLFKHPDMWTDLTPESFKDFVVKIEDAIEYFSKRNNSEFENLRFISHSYMRY
jgi:hypothetical protein